MIADGRGFLATAWWISLFPGLAMLLTVLAVNLMGDWLRDHLRSKAAAARRPRHRVSRRRRGRRSATPPRKRLPAVRRRWATEDRQGAMAEGGGARRSGIGLAVTGGEP